MDGICDSNVFRLSGGKSKCAAMGAAVTVEAGTLRQTKYVQAGSGFLSQHTKELFFGLGQATGSLNTTIRWPSGLTQQFDSLPVNRRIEIHEGSAEFQTKPFAASPQSWRHPETLSIGEVLPSAWGTWLIEPVKAPEFSLPDLSGNLRELRSFQGKHVLLTL